MNPEQSYSPKKSRFNIDTKKRLILGGVALIAFLLLLFFLISTSQAPSKVKNSNDSSTQIKAPAKTLNLNKDFSFSIKNDKGEEVAKVKYTLVSAELRDEIVIKGQKASAVEGRQFLVINIKLINDSSQKFVINTRDYIRLSLNGNEKELLAPDIHNDPVEVQAISTKETRVGFPISKTDKDLNLKVGEIKGDKVTVDLKF